MYATYLRLDIHVWASDRAVIRAAWRRLDRSALGDRARRDARKRFYREMLRHHADTRQFVAHFRL